MTRTSLQWERRSSLEGEKGSNLHFSFGCRMARQGAPAATALPAALTSVQLPFRSQPRKCPPSWLLKAMGLEQTTPKQPVLLLSPSASWGNQDTLYLPSGEVRI